MSCLVALCSHLSPISFRRQRDACRCWTAAAVNQAWNAEDVSCVLHAGWWCQRALSCLGSPTVLWASCALHGSTCGRVVTCQADHSPHQQPPWARFRSSCWNCWCWRKLTRLRVELYGSQGCIGGVSLHAVARLSSAPARRAGCYLPVCVSIGLVLAAIK